MNYVTVNMQARIRDLKINLADADLTVSISNSALFRFL